jgi:hypothetical protein
MGELWQMRRFGFRESMLMALAIYAVARGGGAAAADAAPKFVLPRPQFAAPQLEQPSLAPSFAAAPVAVEPDAFWPSEFRQRPRGISEAAGGRSEGWLRDMPRLQDNSMAHQVTEFKSQDRLRLLTLWQSHASSLSLQAGKHGAPSLQWSTPWVRREGGPRGLFDHLLSVPPHGAFGGARNAAPRQSSVLSPSKALESSSAAKP